MRALLLMLLLALVPFSALAQDRLEFSAGQTYYGTEPGIWYNTFYPFSDSKNVGSQMISYRIPGWRASFVHLGEASVNAVWGANEYVDEVANPSLVGAPVYGGTGYGDIFGVSAGKAFEDTLGGWTVGMEGGLFLYRGEWHETSWALSDPSRVLHDDTWHVNLTTYGAASARRGILFAEYRVYYKLQNGFVNRSAKQIQLGVSIPFGAAP